MFIANTVLFGGHECPPYGVGKYLFLYFKSWFPAGLGQAYQARK